MRDRLIYEITKVILRISAPIFFRKIHVRNVHLIPDDRPVLLACNHPNAFLDALVVPLLFKPQVSFLARSDVFNNPVKRFFLRGMNIIPIYRLEEGADNLHKNGETFSYCFEIMKKKNMKIMVFSEGICVQEKRLRKLKKGTARIAFGAEESYDFNLNALVVGVGLNYVQPSKFGNDLCIDFAEPFAVNEFAELYKKDKPQAIMAFNKRLEQAMKDSMVIIEPKLLDGFPEQVEEILKRELFEEFKLKLNNTECLYQFRKAAAAVASEMYAEQPERTLELKEKVNSYHLLLKKYRLKDFVTQPTAQSQFAEAMLIILCFPLFLFGLLNNYIPFKTSHLATKVIVKKVEFFSSVNFALGTFVFFPVFYVFVLIAVKYYSTSLALTFYYLAAMVLTGLFALKYKRSWKKFFGRIRFNFLKKNKPAVAKDLLNERAQVVTALNNYKNRLAEKMKAKVVS